MHGPLNVKLYTCLSYPIRATSPAHLIMSIRSSGNLLLMLVLAEYTRILRACDGEKGRIGTSRSSQYTLVSTRM